MKALNLGILLSEAEEDVKNGIIASKIEAHVADIAKGFPNVLEQDNQMAEARKNLDWATQTKLSLDPERVRQVHSKYTTRGPACSMCGDYCAMAMVEKYLGVSAARC